LIGREFELEAFSGSISLFEGDNLQLHPKDLVGGLGLSLSGIMTSVSGTLAEFLTFSVKIAKEPEEGDEGIVPAKEAIVPVMRRDVQTSFISFASSSLAMGIIWSMSSAHTLNMMLGKNYNPSAGIRTPRLARHAVA
jgi:hypothetical protein